MLKSSDAQGDETRNDSGKSWISGLLPPILGDVRGGHMERVSFFGDDRSVYRQHLIRYRFAAQNIGGIGDKRVLDVPCGIGYGSDYLARHARWSTGIDISSQAIAAGIGKYLTGETRPLTQNLSLLVMDAQAMQFPDAIFDAAVSFEGLEHVPDPKKMLSEISRVLKDDGVLVLSTPNKKMSKQKRGKPQNPFHLQEYTREELEDMLGEHFSDVKFYGQNIVNLREGTVKRKVLKTLASLDFLRLRRFIRGTIRRRIIGDTLGDMDIREVNEDIGEAPYYWIAVCKKGESSQA